MTPAKFEDTKLLQHPEVQKAYDYYFANRGPYADEERDAFIISTAETVSQLGSKKDPNAVAAIILLPLLGPDLSEAKADQLMKTFDPLTFEYAETTSMMMHPMGITEVFPSLPRGHREAAITFYVASALQELREIQKHVPVMTVNQLRDAVFRDEDPVMPSFADMVAFGRMYKTEPKLMAAFDGLKQELTDIVNGVTPKPSAPKNAPKP